MVCGVNPCGPEGKTCKDFVATDQEASQEERQPLGGGYYAGDWIPQPFPLRSAEEQLALLNWHPQFSGRCPNCEMPIPVQESGEWACGHCNWKEQLGNPLASSR